MSKGGYGDSPHMKGVAISILVMGISLTAILLTYVWFGHIGPDFSNAVMEAQQDALVDQFDLPPRERVSPELLETPPSLRNSTATATTTDATATQLQEDAAASQNATASSGGESAQPQEDTAETAIPQNETREE